MTIATNSARETVSFGIRLAMTLVSIALIACSQDKQEQEDVRIQAISGKSGFPLFDADSDQKTESAHRILLDFDNSPFHTSETYNFFRLGNNLSYATDQGHRKRGSIRVSNRTATWQGPLLTLPPLEAKSYTASVWVKLINTQRTASVKLILMQISDNSSVNVPLSEVEVTPGAWQKVEGRIAGIKSEDNLHVLRMEVKGEDIDYLVDDILVEETALISTLEAELELDAFAQAAPVSGLITNGGLEEGLEPWTYQGGKLSRSKQQAHSGEYSLLITERTLGWHAPVMKLNALEDNTSYRFSIFVRLAEDLPTADVQLTLSQIVDGKPNFFPIANMEVTNSRWTEVAGNISAPNFSMSEQLSVYLESSNPLASYYVDSLTVVKQ